MFQKQEVHHNSPAQVKEYLERALKAVEELDPPEDLRPLVFANAVQLFSAKQVMLEQVGVVPALPGNARH